MAFKHDNEMKMEQVAAFLKDAVKKIESNPELYEELKKTFKKSVPLTRRSYVAAYLLKNLAPTVRRYSSSKSRDEFRSHKDDRRSKYESRRRPENESKENKEKSQRIQIPAELASTVFVGIGRNRRVFPRDLVGLIISVAGVEKERIGAIKVLANYSFVELFKEDADKVIDALNGYEYRGKKINVSPSSKKEAEKADNDEAVETVPNVENTSAPIVDSFTAANSDTMAQQAAFAKAMENSPVEELSDEEIMAMRAPRSSSSADIQ